VISSADTLCKLTGFKMYDSGHVYDFACLQVGDRICNDCRKAAMKGLGQPSPGASPRRSEALDLGFSSPIVHEATALALQSAPSLNLHVFSELRDSHPWRWSSPAAVLPDLQQIPELALVFADLVPIRQRELLSGISKAMQPHLIALEQKLSAVSSLSFTAFASVVEKEFSLFYCRSLSDAAPFDPGAYKRAQVLFNSDSCANLRVLLRQLVSPKGSARNFARQSEPMKLRKVALVLLQLGKLGASASALLLSNCRRIFLFVESRMVFRC
jgi:hypothetical protein